jgi:prepilin-type N-terminal cleavage/methylation domain-containing protein
MRLSNVRKHNRGFTLVENLVIVVILGIMASIATPSFLAFQQRQHLYVAMDMVANVLGEAQQKSIERGSRCQITLTATKLVDSQYCLVGGDRALPKDISLESPGLDNSIEYGIKGNTVDNRTIILRLQNSSAKPRCMVISAPLGVTRQGFYNDQTNSCRA